MERDVQIIIEVNADNDAFQLDGAVDMPTVCLNANEVIRKICNGQNAGTMCDANGNTAIKWHVLP